MYVCVLIIMLFPPMQVNLFLAVMGKEIGKKGGKKGKETAGFYEQILEVVPGVLVAMRSELGVVKKGVCFLFLFFLYLVVIYLFLFLFLFLTFPFLQELWIVSPQSVTTFFGWKNHLTPPPPLSLPLF